MRRGELLPDKSKAFDILNLFSHIFTFVYDKKTSLEFQTMK